MKFIIILSLLILSLTPLVSSDNSVQCKDNHTTCGTDGCCPYANGTCCTSLRSCCPNGYICNTEASRCDVSGNSDFLSMTAELRSMERGISLPDINAVIQCIKDVWPVFTEVEKAIELYKSGDHAKLMAELLLLLNDGVKMTKDCAKVVA
jgi:hypothetical protein